MCAERQPPVTVATVISASESIEIQRLINSGAFINKSDFIRNAIRNELTKQREEK
jgi:Arc/MetJ-type ribon-helix-helix transcriptional regulator